MASAEIVSLTGHQPLALSHSSGCYVADTNFRFPSLAYPVFSLQTSSMESSQLRHPVKCEFMPNNYFAKLDPFTVFNNDLPLEVDLGCGDGSFLIAMAQHYPERNFLGVERLLGRVKRVCRKATEDGLNNCKVLRLESKYVIEWLFPEESIQRVHLLCPDPWPKARHHKNRLIQQGFLTALFKVLKPGGEFCFKTDHKEYYDWVIAEMAHFKKFNSADWQENAFFYPKTDFQLQWEAEGKVIERARFTKPL